MIARWYRGEGGRVVELRRIRLRTDSGWWWRYERYEDGEWRGGGWHDIRNALIDAAHASGKSALAMRWREIAPPRSEGPYR